MFYKFGLTTIVLAILSCGQEASQNRSSTSVFQQDPAPVTLILNEADSLILYDALNVEPAFGQLSIKNEIFGYGFRISCMQNYVKPLATSCAVWAERLQTRTNAITISPDSIDAWIGFTPDMSNIYENIEFSTSTTDGNRVTKLLSGKQFKISCQKWVTTDKVYPCKINVKL